MADGLHVILGSGPVGCWIARALRQMNYRVRVVNRTGHRPKLLPEDVEVIAADLADPANAGLVAKDAAVIYQAVGPPYHLWHELFPRLQKCALQAAREVGARYISIENLYMFDSSRPMTEDSPICPISKKGVLRARMAEEVMAANERGEIRATALRSSDYYGPGVLLSALGERVFGNLLSGKKAQILGSPTIPHSFAYIEDVGLSAAVLGTNDNAKGKVWIAPHATANTQVEIIEIACSLLGIAPRMTTVSPLMLRLAGMFDPGARETVEMMYEFTRPFVVDSHRTQSAFGLKPTPIRDGIESTLSWYREYRYLTRR